MKSIVKTYRVKVVQEAGRGSLSGQFYNYGEQEIDIDSTSPKNACQVNLLACEIPFGGQTRGTFIDGEGYFNEEF